MATENYRTMISLSKETEDAIYDLRKREEFKRMSFSEITRHLILRGLKDYTSGKLESRFLNDGSSSEES